MGMEGTHGLTVTVGTAEAELATVVTAEGVVAGALFSRAAFTFKATASPWGTQRKLGSG